MSSLSEASVLESPTGARLLLRQGAARGTPRAVIVILHGLAEHSGRYKRFAAELAGDGFHVVAHDHRGHGGTTAPDTAPRRFAVRDGAEKVLRDCEAVIDHSRAVYPGLPLIVFGHSMGSILAANVLRRRSADLAGVALWNGDLASVAAARVGRLALRVERMLKGSDVSSGLFSRLTFEAWAKAIPNRRSEADWLSHDPAAVAAYEADPFCGFRPTISLTEDLLRLVITGGKARPPENGRHDLPIHLLGGGADPATGNGRAVDRFAERLRDGGWTDVAGLTVPGARHETLNETEDYRRPAMAALGRWLDRIAPR